MKTITSISFYRWKFIRIHLPGISGALLMRNGGFVGGLYVTSSPGATPEEALDGKYVLVDGPISKNEITIHVSFSSR